MPDTSTENLTVKLFREEMERLKKQGYRVLVCPQCTEVYKMRYATRIISCGKCGYKAPKDEPNQAPTQNAQGKEVGQENR